MSYASAWLPEFWQLYEILRKLGEPDLLKDGLIGAFDLRPVNILQYSENMEAQAWYRENLTGYRTFDAYKQAFTEDFTSSGGLPAFRNGLWYEAPMPIGQLDQEVEVAPGETYTFSFYALGVIDYQALQLAVLDVDHNAYLVLPTPYGGSLTTNDYTRVQISFRAPEGCTRVRVQAVTQSLPFVVRNRDPHGIWLEVSAIFPSRLDYTTRTLHFQGQSWPIVCADLITN